MKRNIEIDDTMQERIDSVNTEIKKRFDEIVKENPDYGKENGEDIYQEICDYLTEMCDAGTPIYNKEIDDLYYLYGNELENAYNNAGCYDTPPHNYRHVCIFFYLEQQAHDYLQELLDEFEEGRND